MLIVMAVLGAVGGFAVGVLAICLVKVAAASDRAEPSGPAPTIF